MGLIVSCAFSWQVPLSEAIAGLSLSAPDDPLYFDSTSQPDLASTAAGFDNSLTGGWSGERQRLQDAGIAVGATLTPEGFSNLQGGIDTTHLVGATTFDLNLALDTDKLFHFPGGEFYVDVEDHAFRNPSTALVGDLQVFDKQNASPYLEIFELWYQQKLFNDKIRVKIGKVDANTEFMVIDNGLAFINSSSQLNPTVFLLPTTPDPMPSLNLFYTPSEDYFAGFGAYYANRSDRFGELVDDTSKVQPAAFGTFLIGETGLKWKTAPILGRPGNFKVGAWGHTGTFARFDGTQQEGTYGYYTIFDQTLWQMNGEPDDGRGVRTFLEYGVTEDTINGIDRHIGGGITWTGPIDDRPNDIIGFSPQYAHISPQARLAHPYELALEAFYEWRLFKWAFVQPDLQYIVHPGGTFPDALVATLRFQITF
jgi:porin